MSPGQTIHLEDMPPELTQEKARTDATVAQSWESALADWADRRLANGDTAILEQAIPSFERVMITTALRHSGGRRQDAAILLGWGRNTLTRKIKELDMESSEQQE
jgi:two-component system nitrogen regulation response regulator GlnG